MSDREQIIERINKLLAHSVENGATEAEAVAFALKAQKLIADNDIEDWELGEQAKQEVVDVITENSYARTWRGSLAFVIAENFRCKALVRWERPRYGRKAQAHIRFIGYEADAQAAALVFDHLYKVGDRLGKAYRKECGGDRYAYDNFVYGFVEGIQEELEKQCQALMLVCPQEVEDYYNGITFTKGRTPRRFTSDVQSQEKGRIAGRDAVRSRRIEKQESLLLTA